MTHSHSHDHGLEGGWSAWLRDTPLRIVLGCVVAAAIATVVALVALWPSGEGRRVAIENADQLGLVTDRVTATVDETSDGPCSYSTEENPQTCRVITLTLTDGAEDGAVISLAEINLAFDRSVPRLEVGEQVILGYEDSTNFYFYVDRDRRGPLLWLSGIFAVFVIALGRLRGGLAIAAMALTLFVLVGFVAPSVLDGNDPVLVAVVAASVIAFVSLYLTHGFSPTTTVALAGTLGALLLTLGLSALFFALADFTGFATEEALILPSVAGDIDVAALLLGGAVIGALGALDDVTVTQVSTVAELRRRSPTLPTSELVASGIRVGRDHIASTVNTLLLAYAGASMPILLLFAISDQSLAMVANSELVAVEIVRTLCGSIGLVAAVPITTGLAAMVLRPTGGERTDSAEPSDDLPAARDPGPAADTAAPDAAPPTWDDFSPEES
ncbi:MAG: YibE/F family protein [Actinomycetota bacterium]